MSFCICSPLRSVLLVLHSHPLTGHSHNVQGGEGVRSLVQKNVKRANGLETLDGLLSMPATLVDRG